MLNLEYTKFSFSPRCVTARTAVRTPVSLGCPTATKLFREKKQWMWNLSHLGQELQDRVLLLLAKATPCGMKSYLATQGRMTGVDISTFSSGFLLHLKPVLPAPRQKDSAKSKSRTRMNNLNNYSKALNEKLLEVIHWVFMKNRESLHQHFANDSDWWFWSIFLFAGTPTTKYATLFLLNKR